MIGRLNKTGNYYSLTQELDLLEISILRMGMSCRRHSIGRISRNITILLSTCTRPSVVSVVTNTI
jgi:hypothetical protein